MFISEYFQTDISKVGVFDALLDKDSNFFINIIRLKQSTIPEYVHAYECVNRFFSDIATLLNAADAPNLHDKMYREARRRFSFHEVNGINLGFSTTPWGAGWGDMLSDQVLADAYQIIKKGSKQPEIFHLVNLFEEGIAGDRLSDMIATIIEPQIIDYTKRIMAELGITPEAYQNMIWRDDGLVKNPVSNYPILLLPEEILHELPIARDWYEIGDVIERNSAIRAEISAEIGEEWSKWASSEQKQYLKEHVFMDPEICNRVIEGYRSEELAPLDTRTSSEYMAEVLLKNEKGAIPFTASVSQPSSFEAAMDVINYFKEWVESNRGWAEIQGLPTRGREKTIQRLIHLSAKHYIEVNNIDLSPETDSGRGPVDFKFSRGNDKTLVEIKLSSNSQYRHGYEAQVEEYGLAERTQSLIYVFIDVGHPGRLATIQEVHRDNKIKGIPCPDLIVIDARKRDAASTFTRDRIFFF